MRYLNIFKQSLKDSLFNASLNRYFQKKEEKCMSQQEGFKIKGWHIVVVLLLIFGAWYFGLLKIEWKPAEVTPQPQPTPTGLVAVTKPVKFSLTDPLKGIAVGSASLVIYGPDKTVKESLTTDSTGVVTSALPYSSDSEIYVKISKSGYVTYWQKVVIPRMTPSDAQALTTNYVALQDIDLGSYVIKVTDQFGNSYTSGGNLNFTTLGVTTITITVSIYEQNDNEGYWSSFDLLNGINQYAVLQTVTTGSKATINGAGEKVVIGTTNYWISVLKDDDLIKQKVGNDYTKKGVCSIVITLGQGSLVKGNTETYTFNLMDYFDPAYFKANGIGGPNSASLASFTLNLQA
jgi:hypothetical protein